MIALLVVNRNRPRAVELAQTAAAWLIERGHGVRLPKEDAQATGLDGHALDDGVVTAAADVDLALALGGDGTMLRTVHLASANGTPVLGVNLGRLAYLAALEPEGLEFAMEAFLAGEYDVEPRAMLDMSIEAESDGWPRLALNEAVLEHAGPGHTVHLAVHIDGRFFTSHVADALIVGTPTGSTAYAFSAGGPIVSPRHRSLLVTPVAPHTPFTRSLVLHEDEPVRVEVLDHRGAILSVDGQEVGPLRRGDALVGSVAAQPAYFVTFGERDFFGVLKAKFGLADR